MKHPCQHDIVGPYQLYPDHVPCDFCTKCGMWRWQEQWFWSYRTVQELARTQKEETRHFPTSYEGLSRRLEE